VPRKLPLATSTKCISCQRLQAPTSTKALNGPLTAVYAAIVAFCTYTCIFCFRKAFNVSAYQGYTLMGLDFKTAIVITQVAGYMCSKFYGIKFIAELKKIGRGKLIIILILVSWLAWLLFALIPPPYNFWTLFLNGFPLGLLWGVVFSYVEGRRTTDFISAALAVSFIFGSGVSKSTASWVMEMWGVNEYWMPFVVGLIFFVPLLLFVFLMEKIPAPDGKDIELRTIRVPMDREKRREFLQNYFPGLAALVLIYILVTILREVRDNYMADMWRESGETFQSAVFVQTETIISLVMLVMIASMIVIKNNFKALGITHGIMAGGFILSSVTTLLYLWGSISMFGWTTAVGLGLYMVYIPFNSLLFDRLIAAFRFAGTVGFLIYVADSFGYLGSVAVLLSKSIFKLDMNWLYFYQYIVLLMGVIGLAGVVYSFFYFKAKRNIGVQRASAIAE
jgi:MFS family permease